MKKLLILRHGKAELEGAGGDRCRVLTSRGRRDSLLMGRRLANLVGPLSAIVTSDAARARETAEIAASSAGFSGRVSIERELYAADLNTHLHVLRDLPESADSILLVGHNPSLEQLCEELLAGGATLPFLVTAGLVHMELEIERWRDLHAGCARLCGFYSPKEIEAD